MEVYSSLTCKDPVYLQITYYYEYLLKYTEFGHPNQYTGFLFPARYIYASGKINGKIIGHRTTKNFINTPSSLTKALDP